MTKKTNGFKRNVAQIRKRFDRLSSLDNLIQGADMMSLEERIDRLEERALQNEVPLRLLLLAGQLYGKYLRSYQGAGALPGLPEPNITNEELQLLQKLLKRIEK